MILSNSSCNYIRATSTILDDVLAHLSDYKNISVKLTKNCCSSTEYTTIIDLTTPKWDLQLFRANEDSTGIHIDTITVKNVITGIETTITINAEYNGTTTTTALGNALNTFISASGITPSPSVVYTTAFVGTVRHFYAANIPYPFALTKMQYTKNSVSYSRLFNFAGSSAYLSGDDIIISPAIIADTITSFTDGIYTAEIVYTKNNNSTVTETSCIFMDCTIKCLVAAKLETLTTDSLLHVIYYALIEASNCSCQCQNMCDLYKQLTLELGLSTLTGDCNCG